MFKTFAFSLVAISMLAGSVLAQSGNRQQGSSSRQTTQANQDKQVERENAKTILKYVGLIERGDFASITLDREQKTALKAMVTENIEALNATTANMVNAMPEESRRPFQNAFIDAREGGSSTMASIKTGLTSVQADEALQEQVMALNAPRQAVMDRITAGVTELLTPEQQQTLAAANPASATEEVQEGSGARPAGSATKAAGSETRQPAGSQTRPPAASGAKPAGSGAKAAGSSSR